MARVIAALFCGALFGAGLAVSRMVNPAKVIAFLDVTGSWDPSLALVMASALAVTALAQRYVLKRPAPLLDGTFRLPAREDIDRRLLAGAGLFGIGWGLSGFCPGPAIASLAFADPKVLVFVAAMIGGAALHRVSRQPSAETTDRRSISQGCSSL